MRLPSLRACLGTRLPPTLVVLATCLIASSNCSPQSGPSVYYVDFQAGSDASSGLSPDQAWRHAPGDTQATERPLKIRLAPGDTVRFRGGTIYRGTILLPASGKAQTPITYAGDQWGPTPAIIDGSDPVGSVAPCPSAEACGGAPNWENLSLLTFTPPPTPMTKFFDDTGMLFESQYPTIKDPFFADGVAEYVEIPAALAEAGERGEIISKALSKALDGDTGSAQISVWVQGNQVARRPIVSVNGDSIQFTPDGVRLYRGRPGRAAIVNSAKFIDRPGLYATLSPGRAVAWLRADGGHIVVGSGRRAIDLRGRSDVTIRGFIFEHFVGLKHGEGVQITNTGGLSTRPLIEKNTFRQSALFSGAGAIMIGRVDDAKIIGNRFSDLERGSGIRTNLKPVSNLEIAENSFERLGRTGILVMGASNAIISKNRMDGLSGIHGNGISLYLDNRKVLVADNRIVNASRPMTFHGETEGKFPGDHEIVIERNILASKGRSAAGIISFGKTRGVTIRDNILIGDRFGLLLHPSDRGLIVTDNYTDPIQIKGDQPRDWIVKDNKPVGSVQRRAAGLDGGSN